MLSTRPLQRAWLQRSKLLLVLYFFTFEAILIFSQSNLRDEDDKLKIIKKDVEATRIIDFDSPRDPRNRLLFNDGYWYLHLSGNVNYFNLGNDFSAAIGQIEGLFAGDALNLPLLTLNTNFSMQSDREIKRAPTYFIPTGNIAFGFDHKKHSFEFEFSIAGLVPLNTIDVSTGMTLQESRTCTPAQMESCPMAKMGFVNSANGRGQYDLNVIMNEDIWLLGPTIYYNYHFMNFKFGEMYAGVGTGLFFISARQQIKFSATRKDLTTGTGDALDQYRTRRLEGYAVSTAVSDPGPIFRLYLGIRPPVLKGLNTNFRIGFSYGFVVLNRDVEGSGQALLGDTLAAGFPTTSLGFNDSEKTKFEMMGAFIQAGIVF